MSFIPERYAAIDVGTNTIKIKITERTGIADFAQVLYRDFPSFLGKNMDSDDIIDIRALEGCFHSLNEIKKILEKQPVVKISCIGTHALRTAKNQKEVVDLIRVNTGFDIQVISGEQESRLTLLAILRDTALGMNLACLNVGGGSTELSFHLPSGDKYFYFDFGSVNLFKKTKLHLGEPGSTSTIAEDIITTQFEKKINISFEEIEQVVAVGGSISNAGYIFKKDSERNFNSLNGLKLTVSDLESVIALLEETKLDERKNIAGIDPNRLDSIIPGVLINYFLLKLLKKQELIVSTRTISDAIIYDMVDSG